MAKGYSFTITVDNTQRFLDEFDDAKEITLEAIGMHIEGEAKIELSKDPKRIDTGLLRNSITHALSGKPAAIKTYSSDDGSKSGKYSGKAPKEGDAVFIGSNVEYSAYVHEGVKGVAPNRYLKNAVENNKSQIEDIIKRYLKI